MGKKYIFSPVFFPTCSGGNFLSKGKAREFGGQGFPSKTPHVIFKTSYHTHSYIEKHVRFTKLEPLGFH